MEGFGNQQDQLRRNDRTNDRTSEFAAPGQAGIGAQQGVLGGQQHHRNKQQGLSTGDGVTNKLHRSNSSSSESDGEGGRRKKGLTDKIKEKIPGQHNQGQTGQQGFPGQHNQGQTGQQGFTGTNQGYGSTAQHGQKEGMMDKIKDKISGNH